jgi:HSP20 family protein
MWSEMDRLQSEMNRIFGRKGDSARRSASSATYPPLNVWQDDDRLYVEAELPGMALEDLEIQVMDNRLSIKGERKRPEIGDVAWHRQERGFGPFGRAFELPEQVDSENAEAEFRNGVLLITLPKREESKPRKIMVKGE